MSERIAVYARVSSEGQAERQTIEGQLHNCQQWAAARDFLITEMFREEGVSGSVPFAERPEGKRLLTLAEAGLVNHVVVYCPDRLGRDVYEALAAMRTFKRLNVAVDFVVQSFDDTPEGILQFQVLLAVAEFERKNIARRTQQGRYRRVRDGAYMASIPPYGYDVAAGNLTVNEEQARIVRHIFQWAREGSGLHAIATRLEAEGVPLPIRAPGKQRAKLREWHPTTVYKMLTNPRYIGRATYAGQPMQCPAIIDPVMFQAVQVGLAERRGRSLAAMTKTQRHFYLLRGMVHCRECGGTVGGETARKPNGWERSFYECQQRRRYKAARARHVKGRWFADEVEDVVRDFVVSLLREPEKALATARLATAESEAARQDVQRARLRAQAELDGLDGEEANIITWARKGHITEAAMLQQLDQIKARRTELEAKVTQADPPSPEFDPAMYAQALQHAATVTQDILNGKLMGVTGLMYDENLRGLLPMLVSRVWLEVDGSVTVEGSLPAQPVGRISPPS